MRFDNLLIETQIIIRTGVYIYSMVLIKYKLYVGVKTPDLNTYNDYRLSTMHTIVGFIINETPF